MPLEQLSDLGATPYPLKADWPAISVPVPGLREGMGRLRSDFDQLVDLMAVDRADKGFELLYRLRSLTTGAKLLVSTFVPRETPRVPSVCRLWPIAEWQEREVYDLFGVEFEGHPDLRRLFLEDSWQGFPLRKDYEDDFILIAPEVGK